MSIVEGKVWGTTRPLIQSSVIEVHIINVHKNGCCSRHSHQSKINAFYVIEGELMIRRWKNYDMIDKTILRKGDMSIVPAGESHQFVAQEVTEALEIYWAELDSKDIVRETVGGTFSALQRIKEKTDS